MSEKEVLARLYEGDWEILDLAPLVKREISKIVATHRINEV